MSASDSPHGAESIAHHQPSLLEGKVAIITGASRGIGAAAAHAFARAGAAVVLAARSERALAAIRDEIIAAGGFALAVPTDVVEPAAVERLVTIAVDAFGHLDAAFNNAGDGHMPTPLADLSIEEFDRATRDTLRGVFLSMKYEIRAMLESGGGAIVNMSSTAGLNGVRGMAGYVAAKHGVVGLTKSAALDYAPARIRVNAPAPGPILTERLRSLSDEARAPVERAVPLGRAGTPDEVAAAAVWLCSDYAAFITGATLPVDGGKLAGGA
ncbi:MAG: SDR family NAD(P)-dependent oxidoreductase [Ktedonobacterales bacterium]